MGLNKPVDFTTAKLLKEKGFDGQCLNFYTKPNSKMFGIDEHYRNYPIKNTPKKLYTVGEHAVLNIENVYFAPTIAEVVCWIYSKYQIWIQVSILKDDEWHYSIRRKDNNWNIEFPTKEKCISIENAYEKGINVVLNTYKPKS